jgi:hypothetical protein
LMLDINDTGFHTRTNRQHKGQQQCKDLPQPATATGIMTSKRPVGRPRALTQALKAEICERIALGETLR